MNASVDLFRCQQKLRECCVSPTDAEPSLAGFDVAGYCLVDFSANDRSSNTSAWEWAGS